LNRVHEEQIIVRIDASDEGTWVRGIGQDVAKGLRTRLTVEEELGCKRRGWTKVAIGRRPRLGTIEPRTEWNQGVETSMLDDGDGFQGWGDRLERDVREDDVPIYMIHFITVTTVRDQYLETLEFGQVWDLKEIMKQQKGE